MEVKGRYPLIGRKSTGIFSMDMAVRDRNKLGWPTRTITELYGYPNVGKSTLAYYLAAKLSDGKDIALCDLEMLDREYIISAMTAAGFDGTVKLSDAADDKGKPLGHERMMMEMAWNLSLDTYGAAILDSVGAVMPPMEMEEFREKGDKSKFGQAFMGRRAFLVSQCARAMQTALRNKEHPSCGFVINHVYEVIGGRGHKTAGGEALKFAAVTRIMLKQYEVWRLSADDTDSEVLGYQVEGTIEKLRFGPRGRKFQFFIVPGYGVHVGASAMLDCINLELVDAGPTVKIDGKSLGYIRKDLLAYAASGKERRFEPFHEVIENYKKELEAKQDYDYSDNVGEAGSDSGVREDDGGLEGGGSGVEVPRRKRKGRGK